MEIKFFPISGNGANCYLVKTETAAIVIDPFQVDGRIITFFRENENADKFVLLTHCHFDHILGAKELRELFGAKIVIGKLDEAGLLDDNISLSAWLGLEQEPFYADIKVEEGSVLDFGDVKFSVMHTPGHTAGSVCYLADDVIFTGDTIFENNIGRTDFPTGDYPTLLRSLKRIKELKGNYTLYSGHGNPTTLEREIKNNPYLNF